MAINIKGRGVGPGYPCFIIAEIGINHNGSLPLAIELIEAAVSAGADAVKFQKRTVPVVYTAEELAKEREFDRVFIENARNRRDIEGIHYEVMPEEMWRQVEAGAPLTNGMLKYILEFGEKEYDIINRRCLELGITWSASPWDGLAAHFINGFEDVAWLKVASACLTNRDLLTRLKAKGKPILMSVGGTHIEQVKKAVSLVGTDNLVLLHCVAAYPPKDEDTNLLVMETLRRLYPQVPVGFSSHAKDIYPSVMAAILGACVVEIHLTLDRCLPGSDHKASLVPEELAEMVRLIRRAEILRGDGDKIVLPEETATMAKLRRVNNLG